MNTNGNNLSVQQPFESVGVPCQLKDNIFLNVILLLILFDVCFGVNIQVR